MAIGCSPHAQLPGPSEEVNAGRFLAVSTFAHPIHLYPPKHSSIGGVKRSLRFSGTITFLLGSVWR